MAMFAGVVVRHRESPARRCVGIEIIRESLKPARVIRIRTAAMCDEQALRAAVLEIDDMQTRSGGGEAEICDGDPVMSGDHTMMASQRIQCRSE